MDQPDAKPTTKVTTAGLSGAAAAVIIWIVNDLGGVDIPGEVGAAISTIVAFVMAYLIPES